MKIEFKVITPYGDKLNTQIEKLHIETEAGYVTILPNHFPLIASVVPSVVSIKVNENTSYIASCASGILKVGEKDTKLIVSSFELSNEIDVERAKKALKWAQDRLNDNSPDIDKNRAEISLKRAMARIKASGN